MNRIVYFIFIVQVISFNLSAQESQGSSKIDFNGYFSGMPSLSWYSDAHVKGLRDTSAWQVVLHNRLNFTYYASDHFTASLQLRNQLIGGEYIKIMNIENGFVKQNYFLPLTFQQEFGDQYMLSLSADRAWVQYTYNNLEIKAGRQRINWGQTFVWNPNDLFNSYNFFDFDYPERPGADAIRILYYPSYTSAVDLAVKIDSAGNATGGLLYRFNKWQTDFQIIAGYFKNENKLIAADTLPSVSWTDEDIVGGLGFSSALGNVSIRGEASYFYTLKDREIYDDLFLISLACDYSFPDQTTLMFEFMYNSNVTLTGSSFLSFYAGTQNVKSLTFTKYNAFGQVTYPVTPLLNASLSGMYFWDDALKGGYLGPSLEYSVGDNTSLGLYYQFFAFGIKLGSTGDTEKANSSFAFIRLKWNF